MYRLKLLLHGNEVKELDLESGREYVFGRGESCDVQLEGQPGISRAHFKVTEREGEWAVEVLSKFGDIKHNGQPVQSLTLQAGMTFKLAGYDFKLVEAEQASAREVPMQAAVGFEGAGSQEVSASAGALTPVPVGHPSMPEPEPEPDFEGNIEATRIISVVPGVPFIRIVEPTGTEETRRLEGRKWIAGREESCEIVLNDRKSSRKQFELSHGTDGFFVKDLGSSNGTAVNGNPLPANERKPIRSGDVIQVGRLVLHFEVRDPNFDKKLMVIAPEVMSMSPALTDQPYEMINFPVVAGPGGAVRVDPMAAPWGGNPYGGWGNQPSQEDQAKKKKMRFYFIVAAILIPTVAFLAMEDDKKPTKPPSGTNMSPAGEAFNRLSPQKQQQVKETYILAKNLAMQGKQALAADQLKKLHELLPDGYENSVAIAQEIDEQARVQRNLQEVEEEMKKQAESRRIVEKNIRDCEKIAKATFDINQLNTCLAPTLERDPSNQMLSEYQLWVQRRVEDRNARAAQSRDYQERIARGRSLFSKAEGLKSSGDIYGAIDTYRRHIASDLPDPGNLKAKSNAAVQGLLKDISAKSDQSIQAAEQAYAAQNLKEALTQIRRAKEIDPKSERAAELNGKYRRELNSKLKEIYEESVINEGLGALDEAKNRWRKILETDTADGEYFKKAKSKLRSYGS